MNAPQCNAFGKVGNLALRAYQLIVDVDSSFATTTFIMSFENVGDATAGISWHFPFSEGDVLCDVRLDVGPQQYLPCVMPAMQT